MEALKEIGNTIRKVLRIDTHTALEARGRYARICVQINVEKPLITALLIGNFKQAVIYKGIQKLCFSCGQIRHRKENCPHIIRPTPPAREEEEGVEKTQGSSRIRHDANSAEDQQSGASTIPSDRLDAESAKDNTYGPWMVVTRKRNGYKSSRYNSTTSTSRYLEERQRPTGATFHKNDISKEHLNDNNRKNGMAQSSSWPQWVKLHDKRNPIILNPNQQVASPTVMGLNPVAFNASSFNPKSLSPNASLSSMGAEMDNHFGGSCHGSFKSGEGCGMDKSVVVMEVVQFSAQRSSERRSTMTGRDHKAGFADAHWSDEETESDALGASSKSLIKKGEANLVSKVYHWVIDNYGSASTPIFGAQIDAFHSEQPWAITWRQLAKNLHTLARAVTFTMLLMDLAINDLIFHAFVAVWSGCLLFSQQFPVSAHMTKSRLPPLVIGLQDMELLVSHSQHANHNRPPYNDNYCIVSAVWNEFLDKRQIFKALEVILFCKLGVRPRSKSEPSSNWTEEIETQGRLNPYAI
nr:fatty acid desaturase 4, chloroplastic [Quercus suber]